MKKYFYIADFAATTELNVTELNSENRIDSSISSHHSYMLLVSDFLIRYFSNQELRLSYSDISDTVHR